ncbi:hypothetical protein KPZU09_30660 [Klebsiella pneumoniae]|uniref:Uncharacterized protein n=1 Tax=Klebsiella pneumoniae TaxID=573 RepID=A0A919HS95_KLEPN|nr:hypothetical protein KPZU09_30660 [Klebsiella pneumoniae]
MGADVLDAEIAQHADGFQRSLTGVLRGNTRFALAPAGDAFKQGAAAVPLRLARGEGGVKMDMRLDEGRDRQPARASISPASAVCIAARAVMR